MTKSACPGYLIVYSPRFGIFDIFSSEFSSVLRPSVRNASNSPIPSTSNLLISDKASLVIISPFFLALAGRVYSSITSIGEKGAR